MAFIVPWNFPRIPPSLFRLPLSHQSLDLVINSSIEIAYVFERVQTSTCAVSLLTSRLVPCVSRFAMFIIPHAPSFPILIISAALLRYCSYGFECYLGIILILALFFLFPDFIICACLHTFVYTSQHTRSCMLWKLLMKYRLHRI